MGLVFLYYAVRYIDWIDLFAELRSINYVFLVLAILSVILGLFIKLLRWVLLIKYFGIQSKFLLLCTAYFSG